MFHDTRNHRKTEDSILAVLQERQPLTLDELVDLVPELTWNEQFHAIDTLSRRGELILRRRGFTYALSLPAAQRQTA